MGVAGGSGEAVGAVRPRWVAKVTDERGRDTGLTGLPGMEVAGEYRPFSAEVTRALRGMMLQVVNSPAGTAYHAFHAAGGAQALPGIEVGGKTGTAEFDREVRSPKGRRLVHGKHVWFVGFARQPDRL